MYLAENLKYLRQKKEKRKKIFLGCFQWLDMGIRK